jgi:hypothetical protein
MTGNNRHRDDDCGKFPMEDYRDIMISMTNGDRDWRLSGASIPHLTLMLDDDFRSEQLDQQDGILL